MLTTYYGLRHCKLHSNSSFSNRAAASVVAALMALGCNPEKCDESAGACEDAETTEPTKPRDDEAKDAATGEQTSDSVDAGGIVDDSTEQPFLYCDGGVSTVPISEVAQVTASCDTAGIGGWWYCFEDGVNPSGCVDGALPFDAERGGLCLKGSTTYDPDYVAWGAGIGLTLNETANGRRPWNAAARNIVGFDVVVTGETNGLSLRVLFTTSANPKAEDPMVDLPGPGEHRVLLQDVVYPLASQRAGEPVDPETLYDAQLMIVGAESEDTYDFCLTQLSPIYGE